MTRYVSHSWNELRGLAGYLMVQCPSRRGGIGGFVTLGIYDLVVYVTNPNTDNAGPFPFFTTFLTLTISGPDRDSHQPGDTDPLIPTMLAHQEDQMTMQFPLNSASYREYRSRSTSFTQRAAQMERGGTIEWWDEPSVPSKGMTYKCDTNLGSPVALDCLQLQYQYPSSALDTVSISPGSAQFFSYRSCYLAISTIILTVINWLHIQEALETLLSFCVQHPLQTSIGGRAFYKPLPQLNGRDEANANANVTSSGVLLSLANITVFTVDVSATLNCTWQAIEEGRTISSCDTA
ncbi:hypothetical protein MMC12_008574 [Toensbergia leucococca]|nr:hypothetical protein [Toensbergia leucococca]